MPRYEYHCSACDRTQDRFRVPDRRRDKTGCPGCGKPMTFVEFPQDSAKPEGRPDVKDPFRKF